MEPAPLRIDLWSDVVCPWCAIGKAHLDEALARFPHADRVQVTWRSFELDPGAPRTLDVPLLTQLARKYRQPPQAMQAMMDQMTARAAKLGWTFRFDRARPGNTFDAHRLIHLAADRGLQHPVKERFLRAYLSEGEAIGDPETLVRLATEAGLEEAEVREVLDSEAWAEAVRADEARAGTLQVTGVPFFLFDDRLAVGGAQPPDVLLRALERAWEARTPEVLAEGASCGPLGCD